MSHATIDAATGLVRSNDQEQFLTFTLGDDKYGVEILRVQEIKGFEHVTPLPNVPGWFLGVINLRGAVVPVLDLRVRLGLEPRPHDRLTVIVILSIGERVVGLVVDAVSDVVDISATTIEPPPSIGTPGGSTLLQGIARRETELLLLLDVQRVVGDSGITEAAACVA